MTMPSESPTLTASHANWGPTLEVAVREVFELMLSCKLTVPENPTNGILDITAMVGIATLTTKASTPNMNCAATTIASTHQRRDVSTGAETI